MSRLIHFLSIFLPPVMISYYSPNEETAVRLLFWHIGVIIPIATIWRMRYYGMSFKEIVTIIPFFEIKKLFDIFRSEKRYSEKEKS